MLGFCPGRPRWVPRMKPYGLPNRFLALRKPRKSPKTRSERANHLFTFPTTGSRLRGLYTIGDGVWESPQKHGVREASNLLRPADGEFGCHMGSMGRRDSG